MTTVIVASARVLEREGLRAIVDAHPSCEVLAAVEDLPALRTAMMNHRPEAVVVGGLAPDADGIDVVDFVALVRSYDCAPAMVVLLSPVDLGRAVQLLDLGATRLALLLADDLRHPEDVTTAVRTCASGGSHLDTRIVERLISRRHEGPAPAELMRLTRRETEVLSAMAEGLNNGAIAARLYLSERAVQKHINAIFSKLDLGGEDGHRRVRAVLTYLSAERVDA